MEPGQSDSPSWSELIKVIDIYLGNRKMKVGNGEPTRFWDDAWCTLYLLR
jgi:hypothetical protein